MKKKIGLFLLVLLTASAGIGGYVVWALHQMPDFYAELLAAEIAPADRKAEAKKFTQQASQLVSGVKAGLGWNSVFTQRQVNSWFIEDLNGPYANVLPKEAADPRVKIEGDSVLIGFKYSHPRWNGVVSLRVRPWVPDPNQLALEISDIKAGTLPIPLDAVLKQVGEKFETRGWRVEWRQRNGNDVLVIDFETGKKKRSILESVQVADGVIQVTGRKPAGKQ